MSTRTFAGVIMLLWALSPAFADDHPIKRFALQGNLDAVLAPGDTLHVRLGLTVVGTGTLTVFLEEEGVAALLEPLPIELAVNSTLDLDRVLVVTPDAGDCGDFQRLSLVARFETEDGQVFRMSRDFSLTVAPRIVPEPPFTPDNFNEIQWTPCDAYVHELKFDPPVSASASRALAKRAGSRAESQVVEGLQPGVRYKYWVEAVLDADTVTSRAVFSTQDNAPPPGVTVQRFSVGENGHVTLRWNVQNDAISFLERYVIKRRERNAAGQTFVPVSTVRFFPLHSTSIPSYYPVRAAVDSTLYIDYSGRITRLPLFFRDRAVALLKTDPQDRWHEAATFLRFELEAPAYVYVALDKNIRPRPAWLVGWESTNPDDRWPLDLATDVGEFRLFRRAFPQGPVELGANLAGDAQVRRRGRTPNMYAVFIEPQDGAPFPFATNGVVRFTDATLGASADGKTVQYRIDALDAAGNEAFGEPSPPIVIDLSGKCKPEIARWYARKVDGKPFGKDFSNTVCLFDPNEDPACQGFRDTDSLRFQAVRDSLKFFENSRPDDVGRLFFDSGWIAVDDLPRDDQGRLCYPFELLPPGEGPDFVNGHTYHYRVRAKDVHGNLSAWSKVESAEQDAAPPGDIRNLAADVVIEENCRTGAVNLSWIAAVDSGSGVQSYQVYRSTAGGDFELIANTTATFYADSLSQFPESVEVTYKIGSTDRLGHVRDIEASDQATTLRVPIAPKIVADTEAFAACNGVLVANRDSVKVCLEGDRAGVLKYRFSVVHGNETTEIVMRDVAAECFILPLPFGVGAYKITVRAEYNNILSTCSDTLRFEKLPAVPLRVTNLKAQSPGDTTGNVRVTWEHPQASTIAYYRVRWWPSDDPSQVQEDTTHTPNFTLNFREHNLLTYQCYAVEVRAVDCLGGVSEPDTTYGYSNRPPKIRCEATVTAGGKITIYWDRPEPLKPGADRFWTYVEVYRDSVSEAARVFADTVKDNRTEFTFHSPERMHTYFFRVQELLQTRFDQPGCPDPLKTGFSPDCPVPFDNGPGPVPLDVQALPVPPDSTHGCAFFSWVAYPAQKTQIELFRVLVWEKTNPSEIDSFDVAAETKTFRSCGLDTSKDYLAAVVAIDEFGQRSPKNRPGFFNFKPRWVFTPGNVQLEPNCFRDSVSVSWDWVNAAGIPQPDTTYGADSVCIQLSINSDFSADTTTFCTTAVARQLVLRRNNHYPFVSRTNPTLYVRMRGKDRFGHFSPWSTVYFGLKSGEFDEVPPVPVTTRVDSVRAPDDPLDNFGKVDVHLGWNAAEDNCSGTQAYRVFRNETLIGETPGTSFVDRGLDADSLQRFSWVARPFDRLGNEQVDGVAAEIVHSVQPPETSYLEKAGNGILHWSPARSTLQPVSYIVEVSSDSSLFGLHNIVPDTTLSEISPRLSDTSYTVQSSWHPIAWRIKSVAGVLESPWSRTFVDSISNGADETTPVRDGVNTLPKRFALFQNYPNPFNPSTVIEYAIPNSVKSQVRVKLEVFDVLGRKIRTLVDQERRAGRYQVVWRAHDDSGRPVGTGIYYFRIQAGDFVEVKKMLLIK